MACSASVVDLGLVLKIGRPETAIKRVTLLSGIQVSLVAVLDGGTNYDIPVTADCKARTEMEAQPGPRTSKRRSCKAWRNHSGASQNCICFPTSKDEKGKKDSTYLRLTRACMILPPLKLAIARPKKFDAFVSLL